MCCGRKPCAGPRMRVASLRTSLMSAGLMGCCLPLWLYARRQGCCKWCAMLVQMQHASHGGDNGAEMRIAAAAKADDLPSDPVFLCGEFQRNKGG